jgi:hypothetical protein
MLVGYAKFSASDHLPKLRFDSLWRASCEKIHTENASGNKADGLSLRLDDMPREGGVWVE